MNSPDHTTSTGSRSVFDAVGTREWPVSGHAIPSGELAGICESDLGRRGCRAALERPVELIRVGLDGMLDADTRIPGRSLEISPRGIALQVERGEYHAAQPWLLGLHLETQGIAYSGIVIRRVENCAGRGFLLGAEFGGPAQDVLAHGTLMPQFDPDLSAFVMPHSPTIYDNWAAAGVIEKVLLDTVVVCPRCGALPTFRNGCRKCRSGRVTTDKLIHHFACAHVGFVADFVTSSDELVCPKCRLQRLVIGSDFEYLTGQHRCRSCGWRDSEVEVVGHCLRCSNRFDYPQGREQELHRYHVHRLDPLAVSSELV